MSDTLQPTAANIRKLMGRKWAAWGEFKNKLVEAGIISSFYEDCPPEWIEAWKRFSGR